MINESAIKAKVTKKNNSTRKKYPLFADQWMTDYDTELQKKKEAVINYAIHRQWMDDYDNLLWFKIEWYKRILLSLEMKSEVDHAYHMFYHLNYEQTPYLADNLCRSIAAKMNWVPCDVEIKAECFGIDKPY